MFTLKFDTGNAVFDYDNDRSEIVRILKEIQDEIEFYKNEGSIIDINGNKIGTWKYRK